MVSIDLLICTRNNLPKLQVSLDVLANLRVPKNVALTVVDQSPAGVSKKTQSIRWPKNLPVQYLSTPTQIGVSRARNLAIQQTSAEVLAWVDDDCILTQSYLDALVEVAELAPVPQKKKLAVSNLVKTVSVHWQHVGLGNNLVLFRSVLKKVGGYKNWLGPGSVGEAAEDGELLLHCLAAGYSFDYDKNLLVYHNKWLDVEGLRKQTQQYTCGGLAVYGGYALQGFTACQQEFLRELKGSFQRLVNYLRGIKRQPAAFFQLAQLFLKESYIVCKGVSLAVAFSAQQKVKALI